MPAVTYHLVAEPYYQSCDPAEPYVPESFDADGFIHCRDGVENVIATANRYYKDDAREYLALVINVDKVTAPIKYEDPERIYPHIFGSLNRGSIASALPVKRDADGAFLSLELTELG